jgi:hypothetical protein
VIRYTKDKIKDVKYVVVEAALKRDKGNKVEGLFIGYQPMVKAHAQLVANSEQFIWLYKGDNIYMLNASHYDISSIATQMGAVVSTCVLTSQKEYIERLKLIHEVFTDDKKILSSGLINADEYTVPEKVRERLNKGDKKREIVKPPTNYSSPGYNARSGGCNYSGSSYYQKKDPSTSIMKRTTKYPITNAIDKMKAKVEEIRQGKYEAPKLPSIPADEKAPAEKDDDKSTDVDDYYDDIYGANMMG